MCVIFSAIPPAAAFTAAALSPPPTTVKASASAMASATPKVPLANGFFSKRPIGPFQKTVFAPTNAEENSATERGPMSSAMVPSGIALTSTVVPELASSPLATTTSRGSSTLTFFAFALSSRVRASGSLSASIFEACTLVPLAARKVLAIAPPITSVSICCRSDSMTAILSETLAPPRTATYGLSAPVTSLPSAAISFSRRKPQPRSRNSLAMPWTLACARCTAPKASST